MFELPGAVSPQLPVNSWCLVLRFYSKALKDQGNDHQVVHTEALLLVLFLFAWLLSIVVAVYTQQLP